MLYWGLSLWRLGMGDALESRKIEIPPGTAHLPKGGPRLCTAGAKGSVCKLHIYALNMCLCTIFSWPFIFYGEDLVPYLFLAGSLYLCFMLPRAHVSYLMPVHRWHAPPMPPRKFPLWSDSQEECSYNDCNK